MKRIIFFGISCLLFLIGCEDPVFTPKPRGYPKVVYPQKEYQAFEESYCDFSFEYPAYAKIQQDTTFFDEKPADPCWFDIYFPSFDSRIYCSYIPIDSENTLEKLKYDAFKMSDWHTKKATYIEETPFRKSNNVRGLIFEVEGPVASNFQFFITDSLENEHFIRGALYFNAKARPDSLAPVYEFIRKDIDHLLETFAWE